MAKCPMCSGEMAIATLADIELVFCPNCKGIWFDDEKLQQVLQLELPVLARIPFFGDAQAGGGAVWDPPPAFCPSCSAALKAQRFKEAVPVITQVCPNGHGLWVDHDKLRRLKASYDGLTEKEVGDDISPYKILKMMEEDNKRVFPIPERSVVSQQIPRVAQKEKPPVFSSIPIIRRLSFEHRGRLIMAGNLILAVIVLSLLLSFAPNKPESRIISKGFQVENEEISNSFHTEITTAQIKTELQLAYEKQRYKATEDNATPTVQQAQVSQKELDDKALADGIDGYLASRGSPLAGTGAVFVAAGNATGVDPILSVAISGKESSFGLYCFAPRNAWGMKAPQYCNGFVSWEEGIWANCRYLLAHFGKVSSPYQCQGYCVPDHPWMEDVATIMTAIQASI